MESRKILRDAVTRAAEEAARSASEQTELGLSRSTAESYSVAGLRSAIKKRAARQVYSFSDPQKFTTAQDPRLRPFSRVSVETLRTLARNYDILAACIAHLKSEVVKAQLKVVPKRAHDDSPETKQQVERAKSFLSVTGGLGGYGCHREEYEALLLDDLLIVGAGCSFLEYATLGARRDGNPDAVTAIDAATIRPLVTAYGFAPGSFEDCYEQWIQGIRVAGFKRDELIYRGLPIFARTDSPYWLSPVELLVSVVYTALKADEWNRTWLTDGNTPDWWMKMPDTMSPDQIIEWLDLFDTMLAGNAAQRHKVKVTPGEPRTGNARKEADFGQFETWLMQRTCSVMGVNPASIGHHSDTYKDSQEIALKSTKHGRIAQLLAFRRSHYNELLERKGLLDVEVQDEVFDAEDAKSRAERHQIELSTGQRTLNETRKEDGLEPYGHPLADVPLVGSSLLVLDSLQSATAPPDDPVGRALRRFEKKALNRLREHGNAGCQFQDDWLPEDICAAVGEVLAGCDSRVAARWVFDQLGELLDEQSTGDLTRYDSSQPRDEDGKWTSGGGAGHTAHGSDSERSGGLDTVKGWADQIRERFPPASPAFGVTKSKTIEKLQKDAAQLRSALEEPGRKRREAAQRHQQILERLQAELSSSNRKYAQTLGRIQAEFPGPLSLLTALAHPEAVALRAETAKITKSIQATQAKWAMDEEAFRQQMVAIMFQPFKNSRSGDERKVTVNHQAKWSREEKGVCERGMEEFSRLAGAAVHRKWTINLDRQVPGKRSGWNSSTGTAKLEKDVPPALVVHEAGHGLEDHNPLVFRAALAFLERRTLGETPQQLNKISDPGYGDDEFVKPDKFRDPYMGKVYKNKKGDIIGTEITSMCLQHLAEDPLAFAREDPDAFEFIHAVLRNPQAACDYQEHLLKQAQAQP